VNAAELFLLGRRLMQIAENALPKGKVGTTVRLVMLDIGFHPGSSISEITERTGFLQSHVSASVAKLRDLGFVVTEIDPADHRRTLVRAKPEALERGRRVQTAPVEDFLALDLGDTRDVAEVIKALEFLKSRLVPKVQTARVHAEATS
jgi:DNA-binding MarR family transcriptional regulator